MTSRDLRILVVGAGIAGLALARALRGHGYVPEIVERAPAWTPAGTGIYLPGNASRALRQLGLDAQVTEHAVTIPRQRFSDDRGRLLVDIDLPAVWGDVGPCLALHWEDLHAVLLRGAGGPVRMGTTVRALALQDAVVTVELSDGTRSAYDLVVGADGIHSTVRRLAFGSGAAQPVGQIGWRFVTAFAGAVTTWSVMLGRRSAFLTIPIGGGRVYCYCDLVDVADGVDALVTPLRERFAGFPHPVPALLDALGDAEVDHVAAIEEVRLTSWSRGPVVVLGDAAHATSPNMAEGAAMALEDALVLAESLTGFPTVAEALPAFEARRRPRTDWVRAQTHRRDRTRSLPPALRSPLLRLLGRRIYHANYRPLLSAA